MFAKPWNSVLLWFDFESKLKNVVKLEFQTFWQIDSQLLRQKLIS